MKKTQARHTIKTQKQPSTRPQPVMCGQSVCRHQAIQVRHIGVSNNVAVTVDSHAGRALDFRRGDCIGLDA
jgi:hypothetical protein